MGRDDVGISDAPPDTLPEDGEPAEPEELDAEPLGRRLLTLLDPVGAPLLAAITTVAAYVVAMAARGDYPFGHRARVSPLMSEQLVPMYTHLWDLAHGRGGGDLLFNWTSGLGVPFLPDLATYLTNPFALIGLALPRADVTAGILLAVPLTMGLAAGVMTVYLRQLAPGRWWLRVPIGVSYGMCGWALGQSTVPVWLWGLAAFPLLCLAGEWGFRRVHWIWATVLVGIAWYGDLATAPAATAGALLVLLVRFLTLRPGWGNSARAVIRVLTSFAVGIGLSGVLLVPMYDAYRAAGISTRLSTPSFGWHDLPASLLPGGGPANDVPGLCVGTLVLVLAIAFPLNRRVPVSARIGWSALVVAVLLSYAWPATERLWQGFAIPGSGSFPGGFVLCGVLVIVAWQCAYKPPELWAVAVAGGLVGLVWVLAAARAATWTLVPVVGGAGLAVYLVRSTFGDRLGGRLRLVRPIGAALLGCAVVAEGLFAAITLDGTWTSTAYQGWSATDAAIYAAARQAGHWPTSHTQVAGGSADGNSGMRYGSQNLEYASVYTPTSTVAALAPLGFGWTDGGRELTWVDDPVTDTILSIGSRVTASAGGAVTVRTSDEPPPMTLHAAPAPAPDVFTARDQVLGATLYYVPPVTTTRAGGDLTLTASCFAGTQVYFSAPELTARVTGPSGVTVALDGRGSLVHAPTIGLGTVVAPGHVTVTLKGVSGTLPADPIGCLDPGVLQGAQAALSQSAATGIGTSGHGIAADLADGSSGTAVLAVADATGWSCTTGHGTTTPGGYYGLLAVPVTFGDTTVACSYTPPGYVTGGLVSDAAVLILPLAAAIGWFRRRD